MPIGATIAAIGGVASAGIGAYSTGRAAQAGRDAQNSALDFQNRVFNTNQANFKPFIDTGQGAVLSLAQLYGLQTPGNPGGNGTPFGPESMQAFNNSPDYAYARDQGIKALTFQNSAGGLLGRNHMNTIEQFGSGLATQNFGNYTGRLMSLAQLGNTSATAAGQLNNQSAAGIAGTYGNIGQINSAEQLGFGNAAQTGLSSITNNLASYNLMNRNISSFGSPGNYTVGSTGGVPPPNAQPVGIVGFNGWMNPDYYPPSRMG